MIIKMVEAEARCEIKLGDALRGRQPAPEGGEGEPVRQVRDSRTESIRCGIRFQRCGGGYRVIRKQRRGGA